MYEESVGIPMILAGDNVPRGSIVKTPVSLIDVFPSILDAFNIKKPDDINGSSLFDISNTHEDIERLVFSEYHGAGAISGALMLRDGKYKLIYYVDFEPEFYDLLRDPEEEVNLATNKDYSDILKNYVTKLFNIANPNEVNKEALAAQAKVVEKNGGVTKVLERGGLNGTPVPGGKTTRIKHS